MGTMFRRRIQLLPASVAGRIAAGEVVERPVSIVKELIENSIDSGADSVVLEIKNGGKSLIRVTDNGCGIPADEAETAFLRHATSKISDDRDLLGIETLGFRGEALASISAVTRTTMITKVPGERSGLRISIEGGKITEKAPVGAADGTTIIVNDLFFNTPVREKFMKKDSTESALVGDFISRMSLAYPDIRFRFINNGKTVFATNGKGDILENIFTVYGKETAENLIEVSRNEGGVDLRAYISNPLYTKSSRKFQHFFVNGRTVSDKVLEEGIERGYGDKVPEGRFPVVFVFIKLGSERVDVNIHPNKKEVRFDRPDEIRTFMEEAVFRALDAREAVGNISPVIENKLPEAGDGESPVWNAGRASQKGRKNANVFKFNHKDRAGGADHVGEDKESWQTVLQTTFGNRSEKDEPAPGTDGGKQTPGQDSWNRSGEAAAPGTDDIKQTSETAGQAPEAAGPAPGTDGAPAEALTEAAEEAFDISSLNVLGVLFGTYIAASDYKTFYLIDQHAAHERVFYEQFLKEFYKKDAAGQTILTPLIKEIPYYAAEGEGGWPGFLKKAGFDLEPFGEKAYIFRAIPSYMTLKQAEVFLDDCIDSFSRSTDFKDKATVDRIIMRSCKSAVKAHDRLTSEEIRALLKDLSKCRNPYSCPHGRPTIVKMTEKDMKKLFKRV